ncbi:MAG: CBS domain-containing protein [Gemmatimonadales bacterium]|nr:MAG: CBS domain-containing protein [Gemmatimonadales bacterium]
MSAPFPEGLDPETIRVFTRAVLRDLQALERMLAEGLVEDGPRRFGAEQELFLVGDGWRPSPVAPRVLEILSDDSFTPELALFNLEANLAPELLNEGAFHRIEAQLESLVGKARVAAREAGAEVILCGTLPTLVKSDMTLDNITPHPRYRALNDALTAMRGEQYHLRIEGADELMIRHDSVMLEACNTSCQVHLQVSPAEFPLLYNAAQLALAPVLAASVNSPVLFGRRLWAETRIALFQQSLDTRSATPYMRDLAPRVRFGEEWVKASVTELFAQDLARFRVLLAGPIPPDPMRELDEGKLPRLAALQLYNSTIYRWNRPCFGVKGDTAHLRIESRALPSGPSIIDEVANAALWTGLVLGISTELGDPARLLPFGEAKGNFLSAAREGLSAGIRWVDGKMWSAPDLLLEVLLPLARTGLEGAGVGEDEISRYLGVIQARVSTRRTGARWILDSLEGMGGRGKLSEQMAALTAAMASRQAGGGPVHEWLPARLEEGGGWTHTFMRVEQYMDTRPVTVNEDELLDLAAFVMDREGIRHIPVEDRDHRLVGLLSYRCLLRSLAERGHLNAGEALPVRDVMEKNPLTVAPETPTMEAIEIMRRERIACLPVVQEERLVGLVTERDFMPIAYELLEEHLGRNTRGLDTRLSTGEEGQ